MVQKSLDGNNMKQIKLIWDFRGVSAFETAKHFEIHLKDFLNKEKITDFYSETLQESDFYSTVCLIIEESYVNTVKIALKPIRAFLV